MKTKIAVISLFAAVLAASARAQSMGDLRTASAGQEGADQAFDGRSVPVSGPVIKIGEQENILLDHQYYPPHVHAIGGGRAGVGDVIDVPGKDVTEYGNRSTYKIINRGGYELKTTEEGALIGGGIGLGALLIVALLGNPLLGVGFLLGSAALGAGIGLAYGAAKPTVFTKDDVKKSIVVEKP